ncbi:MAG: orotate phosphoribosyltransferase [Gammaproteobacteria bacterium]|jgi:orotate phosphoribosyltransferase|nr:orotate phosphoribosyltransferase [Gammaproteobacteria bacterium]MBT6043558.1 orotate phosphoribosyltransferase [Gammaproteobacteria bacterium]
MQDFQKQFLSYVTENNILRFGKFTLKSGRQSPYFFNAGLFNTGAALGFLGSCYAQAIENAAPDFDIIFGPAYKGIPLASAASIAFWQDFKQDIPWCFNRKEAKDHGEGGNIVGSPLENRVLVIDDVITAGTAIRETMEIISAAGATAAGVVVALDRQEKGNTELSAIQEIEKEFSIPVISIINLQQIIDYLEQEQDETLGAYLESMKAYQSQYGI